MSNFLLVSIRKDKNREKVSMWGEFMVKFIFFGWCYFLILSYVVLVLWMLVMVYNEEKINEEVLGKYIFMEKIDLKIFDMYLFLKLK